MVTLPSVATAAISRSFSLVPAGVFIVSDVPPDASLASVNSSKTTEEMPPGGPGGPGMGGYGGGMDMM